MANIEIYQDEIEELIEFLEDNNLSYSNEALREMLKTAFKVNKSNCIYTIFDELRSYDKEDALQILDFIKSIINWEPLQKQALEDIIDEVYDNFYLSDIAENEDEDTINELIEETINGITAF